MFQKFLIIDLINLIGKYTDQDTYITLINLNDTLFTENKLLKNQLDNIPTDQLKLIAKAYEYSNNFFVNPEYNIFSLFSLGTFIKLIKLYKNLDFNFKDRKIIHTNDYGKDDHKMDINEYIIEQTGKNTYDIITNIISFENLKKLKEDIKDKLKNLYNDLASTNKYNDDDYDVHIDQFIREAIIFLLYNDPNFYPLYNLELYTDQIINFIKKDIQKEILFSKSKIEKIKN